MTTINDLPPNVQARLDQMTAAYKALHGIFGDGTHFALLVFAPSKAPDSRQDFTTSCDNKAEAIEAMQVFIDGQTARS